MGMFDYVIHEGVEYQCKDTPDQYMSQYRIINRRLIGDEWHMEDVPWNERRYPLEKGIMHLCGSMRRVIDRADVDQNWHGYLYLTGGGQRLPRYRAKFTDGNLVEFIEVKQDAA
ncbi:MAG TPA: hypothetical protein VEC57_20905 [Candidatus Limnocylindrales bacterium]|nr:hypothetical protein [Candidatus Limnocylindrales bacterium]